MIRDFVETIFEVIGVFGAIGPNRFDLPSQHAVDLMKGISGPGTGTLSSGNDVQLVNMSNLFYFSSFIFVGFSR